MGTLWRSNARTRAQSMLHRALQGLDRIKRSGAAASSRFATIPLRTLCGHALCLFAAHDDWMAMLDGARTRRVRIDQAGMGDRLFESVRMPHGWRRRLFCPWAHRGPYTSTLPYTATHRTALLSQQSTRLQEPVAGKVGWHTRSASVVLRLQQQHGLRRQVQLPQAHSQALCRHSAAGRHCTGEPRAPEAPLRIIPLKLNKTIEYDPWPSAHAPSPTLAVHSSREGGGQAVPQCSDAIS